jgi:hypothetical protein
MPPIKPKDLIDWKFVSTSEGDCWTKCYLIVLDGTTQFGRHYTGEKNGILEEWKPGWGVKDAMGVTVGTGVDMVAISPAELEKIPHLSEKAKQVLRPFAGKKGREAGKLLEGGKSIDLKDAQILDDRRSTEIMAKLIGYYNVHVKPGGVPFERLPDSIRTAIYSFAYQYGPGWGVKQWEQGKGKKALAFWRHIIAQDFRAAILELESDYVGERSRRDAEAALIRTALPAKDLPPLPLRPVRKHGPRHSQKVHPGHGHPHH